MFRAPSFGCRDWYVRPVAPRVPATHIRSRAERGSSSVARGEPSTATFVLPCTKSHCSWGSVRSRARVRATTQGLRTSPGSAILLLACPPTRARWERAGSKFSCRGALLYAGDEGGGDQMAVRGVPDSLQAGAAATGG